MELPNIYNQIGSWLDNSGPLSDIVLSSRIRLARNVAGFLFSSQADKQHRSDLLKFLHERLMATELKQSLLFVRMDELPALERHILTERHLISRQFAGGDGSKAVAISSDESLALMINEEDHLRIQTLASGLQLSEAYDQINRVDSLLSSQIEFAFSAKYGYLTACPTNVGTGLRVSVMLHLPALKMAGQIEKVFRAAKDMRLAVRGLYGEGSEPSGDFYQLSNQTTLGKTESQLINELSSEAVEPIVEHERKARQKLTQHRSCLMEDKIFRAVAIIQNARMISSEETLYMLSYIRLGIQMGLIKNISIRTVNELFLLTQPAHLQHLHGGELEASARDEVRAKFIRSHLSQNSQN